MQALSLIKMPTVSVYQIEDILSGLRQEKDKSFFFGLTVGWLLSMGLFAVLAVLT